MHPFNKQLQDTAEDRRKMVRSMREQGKTWVEIARMLQITPQRAQQLGKKHDNQTAN